MLSTLDKPRRLDDPTTAQNPCIRYLSRGDLIALGGDKSHAYMEAITEGLRMHALGQYVQPLKPYLRWSGADHIADRIIAMPAYLGGEDPIAGIKWVGSRQHNPGRFNLPRASATLILNDTDTNYPTAILEGSLISGMRTAAITAVAARYLAVSALHNLSCIGAGPIAAMQISTLVEQFPCIQSIHLFDIDTNNAQGLSQQLQQHFPDIRIQIHASAEQAIRQGDLVVTCTVADAPYIHYDWLKPGCFLANVSIMDVHKEVYIKADKVVVDDWEQCNREKKIINQLVLEGNFSREQLYAELGELVTDQLPGRENDEEIILLNPMGMAVDDLVCARHFLRLAEANNVGTLLPLF